MRTRRVGCGLEEVVDRVWDKCFGIFVVWTDELRDLSMLSVRSYWLVIPIMEKRLG